jgi:hypothetical protein
MTAGAAALKADVRRFILAFTAVFWISYICWIIGSYANFAVNMPADMQKFGISWSLRLTAEGGFVIALIVGLIVGNFLPRLAELWAEGIGRLAAVYLLSLFGFVIWVGLAISLVFFAGVKPPLVAG